MSYCRWSTDCDLYCYEGEEDVFFIHFTNKQMSGTIRCDGLEYFRKELMGLRERGFRFPDRVLETIEQEIVDEEIRAA